MKKKGKSYLKLMPYNDAWHKQLAEAILAVLVECIFRPLEEATAPFDREDNAKASPLETALKKGTVQFTHGAFRGNITAAISKDIKEMGGVFKRGAWRVASPSLPPHIQAAIAANIAAMQALEKRVDKAFDGMLERASDMIKNMDIKSMGLRALDRTGQDFKTQLSKTMSIMPKLEADSMETLRAEYYDTLEKPIKEKLLGEYVDGVIPPCRDFAAEIVAKMRRDTSALILGGRSRGDIRRAIKNQLDPISVNRAKFIARQETALLTVEFKKLQCKEAGIEKYIWVTAKDHIVRGNRPKDSGNHKSLDGKEYSWDNPPTADHFSTGTCCHPGEDYNCRCQTKPVVEW